MNPRPIQEVIDAIISVIPDSEPVKSHLVERLTKLRSKCNYTAPEMSQLRWADLVGELTIQLGDPDTDWKQLVSKIVTAKVDYKQYLS